MLPTRPLSTPATRPTLNRFRPRLEACEDRSLPSFLASPYALPVGPGAESVAGDLNGDGLADVVTVSQSNAGSRLFVSLGLGAGAFQPAGPSSGFDIGTQASKPATGDFNGDGLVDVVVLNGGNSVRVLLGNGDGTFSSKASTASVGQSTSLAVADLNADGKSDVVLGGYGGVTVLVAKKGGKGLFATARGYQTAGFGTGEVETADVNGDGKRDLVAVNAPGGSAFATTSSVSVLVGNGDGTFAAAQNLALSGAAGRDLAVADFDRDGKTDLAAANGAAVHVLAGNGDGTFTTGQTYAVAADTVSVVDADRDDRPDLAVNSLADGSVSVLMGAGDGTFAALEPKVIGIGGQSAVRAGDFNGDRYPDLLAGDRVYFNAADWGTQLATGFDLSGPATAGVQSGQPFSLTVTAVDRTGNVMANYTGTVRLASTSDDRATMPADYTFTTNDRGVATIDGIVLRTRGWQIVTVRDTAEPFVLGIISISVS